MKKSNKQYVLQTVTAALLIALKIVLERLMSYSVWNQRFGFAFIAVAFAAAMLGTPWAMAVAGIGDILGALLFPSGAYFPGFTLTAVLTAACTAFFIHKNATLLRVTLSVIINQLFGSGCCLIPFGYRCFTARDTSRCFPAESSRREL